MLIGSGEPVEDILSRVPAIISQMRSFREKSTYKKIVPKFLRSLTPKFSHVVAAIKESNGLSMLFFDELIGSLQAHEAGLNRFVEKSEENAFHVKGEASR